MRKLKFIAIFACLFSLHLFGADMPKGDLNVTKIVVSDDTSQTQAQTSSRAPKL